MSKKKIILFVKILLALIGIGAIFIAIFAYQLGMDNNVVMGNRRKLLLIVGLLLLLLHPIRLAFCRLDNAFGIRQRLSTLTHRISGTRFFTWLINFLFPRAENTTGRHQMNSLVWAISGSAIAIFIGFWYLTAGTFHLFTPYSSYYDKQADAFLSGQLSLLEEPPKELAELPNVFDYTQREGIQYIWDASYYDGKYYLYWGPVPALIAAALKSIRPMVVEDQILVFLFYCGFSITVAALLHWLRETWFKRTPPWTVFLFTLTTSLCTPVFFLINRPKVYEAAIMSAQFFLFLGLYGVMRGISCENHKTGWLVAAGFGLGAAVCSRFSYLFAVLFISGFFLYFLGKQIIARQRGWITVSGFIIPMLIFGIGLGWYNFSRFGNILESGIRYQLSGPILPEDMRLLFSPSYFIPNSYSSLIRPFDFKPDEFPFFFAPWVQDNMWPNFIHRSATFWYGEPVAGVFASIPFLWLLSLPILKAIKRVVNWINGEKSVGNGPEEQSAPRWLGLLVSGSAIILFVSLMCYVMATMRFLVDFSPTFILLTVLVTWKIQLQITFKSIRRGLFNLIVIVLCVATAWTSLLFNLFSGSQRFAVNNPELFSQIASFFSK